MNARRWVGILVAGAAVVRLLTAGRPPLSGDEAYHWEWSRHLAGAYYDHPGMTAWCIWLATRLLPDGGELAVRLPAIVGSVVAALLGWGFARDVARTLRPQAEASTVERAGLLAAALITFMPLPAAFGVYMSTDAPLLPVCLALAWAAFAAVQRGRPRAWVCLGIALGAAFSTKLLVLPLACAGAAWLAGSRAGRAHLWQRGPWLALATAILAATPLWWWNATNDWMTFRFNFEIRQREQVASWTNPFVFVAGQLGALTPAVVVFGLVAMWRAVRLPAAGARLLGWTGLLTLLAFLAMSLRRPIGVHWTMPAWSIALILIAGSAAAREGWLQARWARWTWRVSWVLAAAAIVVAHAFALAPEWFARQDFVAGQPAQVARPLFGWREIGREIEARLAAMREAQRAAGDERGVFVVADQYGVAAALAFYTPGRPPVHLWSDARHGANYQFWDDWAVLAGQDALLVSKRPVAREVVAALEERFASFDPAVEFPIVVDGQAVNQFYVMVARRFDGRRPFVPP